MNKEQLLAWSVREVKVWPHCGAAAKEALAPDGVTWCWGDGVSAEPYLWTLDGKHLVFKGEWGAARVACGMPQFAPVQQSKLTADEILTWVARNVHRWEDAQQIVGNQREFFYNSASFWDDRIDFTGCAVRTITRDQWLARRTELQNKPSWADAPEWAEWLAQDEDGVWYWHNETPHVNSENVNRGTHWISKGASEIADCGDGGELLGDWGDTLERRPSVSAEDDRPLAASGRKFDSGKPILGAIPPHAELAVGRVLTFGAEKYARGNWAHVADHGNRYMDAALRHLNAHRRGEPIDSESGESHLAHAACCIMFLLDKQERGGAQ